MQNKFSPNFFKHKLNIQQNTPPILNRVSSATHIQNKNTICTSPSSPYLNQYTPRTQIPKQLDNNHIEISDKKKGKAFGICLVEKTLTKKKQQIDLKSQTENLKAELQLAKKNQRELVQLKNEVIKLRKQNSTLRQQLEMKQNQFKRMQFQKIKSIQLIYQQKIKENMRINNIILKQKQKLQALLGQLENKLRIIQNENIKLKEKAHHQNQFLKRIEQLEDIFNKMQKQVQKGDQQWEKQKLKIVKTTQEIYNSLNSS